MRLIAIDRPGFGLTDPRPGHRIPDVADDLVAVADSLGIGPFSLPASRPADPSRWPPRRGLPERVRALALVSSPAPYSERSGLVGMDIRSRAILVWLPRYAPWLLGPIWNRLAELSDRDPAGLLRLIADTMPSSERRAISSPEIAEVFMDASYEAFRTGTGGVVAEQRLLARDWGFAIERGRGAGLALARRRGRSEPDRDGALARGGAAEVPGAVPARSRRDRRRRRAAVRDRDPGRLLESGARGA